MSKILTKLSRDEIILNEIPNAFMNDEFYLVFQPKMNTVTQELTGVEVLIRWNNEQLGFVSPGEFIPIAEQHGYIQDIGDFVLEESIRIAGDWLAKGYNFKSIAINISPVELSDEQFVHNIVHLCQLNNVPHSKIHLEITEQVDIGEVEGALGTLQKLKHHNFQLVIDDFGSGYADELLSLDVPMDVLKIDKSLVDTVHIDATRVANIIGLAKELGYVIVAEGVETKKQLDVLKDLDCCQVQGYYYSKPLEENELVGLWL